ncbi:LuxR C-terminal-related transcriptional regulator [Pontiellaceae bacterium B1224]|nr:LuxR C-terminal-related transcriptional regulator [Pontiellaceae bacterium B1224]
MKPFVTLERINISRILESMNDGTAFFNAHIHEHPLFHMLTNPHTDVGKTKQQSCYPTFLKTALYNEIMVPLQSQHQIWIAISKNNQFLNCIFCREKEHSENELAMLHLLRPHIESAWQHWKNIRQLKQEFQTLEQDGNQKLRKTFDALPRRQWEIAELVALGHDNQQIADQLNISIRTVQKHLQLIFRTLEIHKRTELVKQWQLAGVS